MRPVDDELEEFEITINHVTPDPYVLDIEEDEAYGQLMIAGAVIGKVLAVIHRYYNALTCTKSHQS